jgi:hypothetical protein
MQVNKQKPAAVGSANRQPVANQQKKNGYDDLLEMADFDDSDHLEEQQMQ